MKESAIPAAIGDFLERLSLQYADTVSLPTPYQYLNGKPVRPVLPLCIAQRGVFIIGAYPSALFATIGSHRDVPVADVSEPFSNETYMDGHHARSVKSGCELDSHYLGPLGLRRCHCWITNMVRVFLFKEGHVRKYRSIGCQVCPPETRSRFEEFADKGLFWLQEELRLASPKVVITLGSEVAGILRGVKGRRGRNGLFGGELQRFTIGPDTYPVIHLAHPGIVMRQAAEKNRWPDLHKAHIARARIVLGQILEG